jgi:hypothetical protein
MTHNNKSGNPGRILTSWNPRLVKTPVPMMLATTMALAVTKPIGRTSGGAAILARGAVSPNTSGTIAVDTFGY